MFYETQTWDQLFITILDYYMLSNQAFTPVYISISVFVYVTITVYLLIN